MNQLVERQIRFRRRLYARRMEQGLPNPLPSFRRGVFSSAELAGLWHLPSYWLESVRLTRSALPRVNAPPGVLRPGRAEGLMRDELGPLALRPEDKALATMVLGLQGTGKSSLLAASVLADALDENCAMFVLDAKSEFAHAALSAIPAGFPRRVHFLDFKAPLLGYNPFLTQIGRYALADAMIEALRAIHIEGSIQAASEEFLLAALIAVMAWAERTQPAGGATFQDVAEVLSAHFPDFRREVVAAIEPDPELEGVHRFLAHELPGDIAESKAQLVTRLSAPRNKLAALFRKPTLDAVLRHPLSIDLDEIVRRREVLIVAGSVEDFGEGQGKALMQLLLHGIHHAVARQRSLPEARRARVALKVDEAHLLFSDVYARMLSMDRSAGLELISAWQQMAQVEPELRELMVGLHRHKFVFSVDAADADLMAGVMQPARSGQIRDDQDSRERMRIPADAMTHMPNHHAACSIIDRGERLASFVAETFELRRDDARIEGHLEAIRARGGFDPGILSRPERGEARVFPDTPDERLIVLEGGFEDREELKKLGARFDGGSKRWYITEAQDRSKFARWLPAESSRQAQAADPDGAPTNPAADKGEGEKAPAEGASESQAVEARAATHGAPAERSDANGAGDRGGSSASNPAPEREGAVPDWRPEVEHSFDASGDRASVAPLGSGTATKVPDSYSELVDFDDVSGNLNWDEEPRKPPKLTKRARYRLSELERIDSPSADERRELESLRKPPPPDPRPDQLEILAALYELRFLLVAQVSRRFMPDKTIQSARSRLSEMHQHGWVRRFWLHTGKRGRSPWVYAISEQGFKVARAHRGPLGDYIAEGAQWREPEIRRAAGIPHDLRASAYLFAFLETAGPFVNSWRGPGRSQVDPPTVRERGGAFRRKTAAEIASGAGERVRDLGLEEFQAVKPDLTIELQVPRSDGGRRRLDCLIELHNSGRASAIEDKLCRYDALLTAWALELRRYKGQGEPPLVLFACTDPAMVEQLARAADRVVTGTIARSGRPPSEWNYMGRKRMFFAAERDLHLGTLRMLKLPVLPPAVREAEAVRGDRRAQGSASADTSFTQVNLLGGDDYQRKVGQFLSQ